MAAPRSYCLDAWRCPAQCLALGADDRRAVVDEFIVTSEPGGFADRALAHKSTISVFDEALVIVTLLVVMGGPLFLLLSFVFCIFFGSWLNCASWLLVTVVLALHPLPHCELMLRQSRLSAALYRYFSYRFVWSGDAREIAERIPAWIGAGPPHGVLPFANVLSIPAINTFAFRHFVGAAASVVKSTPFLRYMGMFGIIDVRTHSARRTHCLFS